MAREPCESRLSAARGRTLRRHRGFISSAAFPAAEKGERRFCRAQLSCRHIRICSQLRPAPGFGEGGAICLFYSTIFIPLRRALLPRDCKSSNSKHPGEGCWRGDTAQIPTSPPGVSPSTIWRHRPQPSPTPAEGLLTSSGCRRVYPACSRRSQGRSSVRLSWKRDALGKVLGWGGCS